MSELDADRLAGALRAVHSEVGAYRASYVYEAEAIIAAYGSGPDDCGGEESALAYSALGEAIRTAEATDEGVRITLPLARYLMDRLA